MKKVVIITCICCVLNTILIGILYYQQQASDIDYSINVPIGNCTRVSYDNYHLTDNGVHIYAPAGSYVEAAMSGVVIKIEEADSVYGISIINLENALISRYYPIDSIRVHVGDYVNMLDTLGIKGTNRRYLRYELYRVRNGKEEYLNPLEKFNECFE